MVFESGTVSAFTDCQGTAAGQKIWLCLILAYEWSPRYQSPVETDDSNLVDCCWAQSLDVCSKGWQPHYTYGDL